MRIGIIGIPGSGKTTLAKLMSGMFDIMYISSGDLARAHGFAGSDAEKSGHLDPNEDKIRALVREAVGSSNRYILDGFPRMISQVEEVDVDIEAVLYLSMYDQKDEAFTRLLKRGRPDDTEEIIATRMDVYRTHTAPLVEYFARDNKLVHVDATGTISHTLRQSVVRLANAGIMEAADYVDERPKDYERDQRQEGTDR